MKVIIEDSKRLLGILLNLSNLRDPFLKLLLRVTVIVPRVLAMAMPSNVSD